MGEEGEGGGGLGRGFLYGLLYLGIAGACGWYTYFQWNQRQARLDELSHGKHAEAVITEAEAEREENKEIFKLGYEFEVGEKKFEVSPREVPKDIYEKLGKGAKVDVVYGRDGEEKLAEITDAAKSDSKIWKLALPAGGAVLFIGIAIWAFTPKKKEGEERGEKPEREREEASEESRLPKIEIPSSEHHHHHHHHKHEEHKESHQHHQAQVKFKKDED